MLIIPAIDLKDGNCVRLKRGDMNDATVFSDDPVAVARQWSDCGGRRLHLVDLNAAIDGKPINASIVHAIHASQPNLPLQIGGGIRSFETIEYYLQAGVKWVIIGTRAVEDPDFVSQACRQFKGKIIVAIDARNGWVASHGWEETTEIKAVDLVKRFLGDSVSAIIYTDIDRDGMMGGVNIEATKLIAESTSTPIIASGGIANMDDIKQLMAIHQAGIMGAITGRAIYQGALDLTAAQCYCDNFDSSNSNVW